MSIRTHAPAVKIWLLVGVIMVFVQVVVGGITRLTGSGLSITKWEIVTGTLPPLSEAAWEQELALYRQTPQYQKINAGMSLSEFKFIYFWEYIHRLWARGMGFVFAIPFLVFWRRGMLSAHLVRRLGVVVLMAAVVASFGWIMVASGLVERPWVNAYKLTMHLSLAFILYSYLLWTTFQVWQPDKKVIHNPVWRSWLLGIAALLAVQIVLGGVVSGMKAALVYPTWPDMHGEAIPGILLESGQWTVENFVEYDATPFMAALVQTLHRSIGYLLAVIILVFAVRAWPRQLSAPFHTGLVLLVIMLVTQVLLGIFTLLYSVGQIPVGLGVLHQAGALVLLSIVLFLLYQLAPNRVEALQTDVDKGVDKQVEIQH